MPTWEVVRERLKQRATRDQFFGDRGELVLCGERHIDDHRRRDAANRIQNPIKLFWIGVDQRHEGLRPQQREENEIR